MMSKFRQAMMVPAQKASATGRVLERRELAGAPQTQEAANRSRSRGRGAPQAKRTTVSLSQ